MKVPVKVEDMCTNSFVIQHSLSTITKWNHLYPFAAGIDFISCIVQCFIISIIGEIIFDPVIGDACAVNAKQHTNSFIFLRMVHMCKAVNAGLLIKSQFITYSIYYSACSCIGSHISGFQDI